MPYNPRPFDVSGHGAARLCTVLVMVVCIGLIGRMADAQTLPAGPIPFPIAADGGVVRYELPAAGPVVRRYEPPDGPYGSGHRGIDLDVAVGSTVFSAAGGTVHHAGPVGDDVWVSIRHDDGILTAYGPLKDLLVSRTDVVTRGSPLGSLAPGGHGDDGQDRGLHFSARRGVLYIDPLALIDAGIPRPSLIGAGNWSGAAHAVTPYEPWAGDRAGGWLSAPSPEAQAPGYAIAPSPNHLIMVDGLASASSEAPFDASHLGYDPRSVTHLSYEGRAVASGDPVDPMRDQRPYGPEATWEGVLPAAELLREQLRAQRRREPGRAVDLVGHSMGGVVIVHYLTHLHDPYDMTLPSIGRVVTIASPHQGSHLAASARALRHHPILSPAIDLITGWVDYPDGSTARDRLPLDTPAIDQLAVGSDFIDGHQRGWITALGQGPAGPLAMGTSLLTIGAAADVVVAPGQTRLPALIVDRQQPRDPFDGDVERSSSALQTVLPGGHSTVLESEAVREAIWLFLNGQQPRTADGGLAAIGSNHLGPALHIGSVASYLYGGFVSGVRRAVATPERGPIEPAGPFRELGQSEARDERRSPSG